MSRYVISLKRNARLAGEAPSIRSAIKNIGGIAIIEEGYKARSFTVDMSSGLEDRVKTALPFAHVAPDAEVPV